MRSVFRDEPKQHGGNAEVFGGEREQRAMG